MRPTFLKELASVPIGQHHIQEHQVIPRGSQTILRFCEAGGMINGMAVQLEPADDSLCQFQIVLYQEVTHPGSFLA